MQSVTGGAPKEALTLRGVSVLEHVIHAAQPFCDSTVVVWRESKGPVPGGYSWIPQMEHEGLAPAIVSPFVGDRSIPTERAAVLLPDTVFYPSDPIEALVKSQADIVIALEEVPLEKVSRYGIVELSGDSIARIVEKPSVEDAPSTWAVSARYVFSSRFLDYLCEQVMAKSGETGELAVTPFIQSAIEMGMTAEGVKLDRNTKRLDCGNPDGYRQAKALFEGESER